MLLDIDLDVLHFFNGSTNVYLDQMVLTFTDGWMWLPLYLALFYLVIKNNETMAQIGLVVGSVALMMLFSAGLTDLVIKPLVARPRPTLDPMIKYTIDVVNGYRYDGYSFFSAHAANTMAVAVFFAWLVRSRMLSLTLILWALLNGWTRLYLGVHYPSDVLVGFCWGAIVATAAYFIYKHLYYKISPRLNFISTQYTTTGYDYNDIDVVMLVFVLTLTVVVISGCFAI